MGKANLVTCNQDAKHRLLDLRLRCSRGFGWLNGICQSRQHSFSDGWTPAGCSHWTGSLPDISRSPKYYLALGTSAGMTAFMGRRFLNSGKFMPAGLVAGVSLLMLARFGARALGLVEVKAD